MIVDALDMRLVTPHKGMGATASGSTIVGAVGGATAATAGALFSSPALMTALGISTAAGPIGIVIAGLVAAGAAIASALGVGSGCGQTCIQATNIVNNAEPLFLANLQQYENGQIDQATAIANYQQMQTAIEQSCGAIQGSAGTNCVSDRFTIGGCKWKATGQPYPASPPTGSCWNWYSGYYLPLLSPPANAPTSTGSTAVSNAVSGAMSTITSNPILLLAGIAAVAGLMIAEG